MVNIVRTARSTKAGSAFLNMVKSYMTASTPAASTPASGTLKPYLIRKNCRDPLNIRKGPGTNYGVQGQIRNTLRYTIVEERSGPRLRQGLGPSQSRRLGREGLGEEGLKVNT